MGAAKIPVKDQDGNEIGEVTNYTFDYEGQTLRVEMKLDDGTILKSMKIPMKDYW